MNDVLNIFLSFFIYLILQIIKKNKLMLNLNIKSILSYFVNYKSFLHEIFLLSCLGLTFFLMESNLNGHKLIKIKLTSVLLINCVYYAFVSFGIKQSLNKINIVINKNLGFLILFYSIDHNLFLIKILSLLLLVFLQIIEVVQKDKKNYILSSEAYFYFTLLVLSENIEINIYYVVLVFIFIQTFAKSYINAISNNINKLLYPFYIMILGGLIIV